MRRTTAIAFPAVIAIPLLAWAHAQEFARVLPSNGHATLSVFGARPVDLAARALVNEFGVAINIDDPEYLHRDDLEDIGATRSGGRLLVPKASLLEMPLDLRADGALADAGRTVSDLRDTANRLFPYEYRVDRDGDAFMLIPTRTRDDNGRPVVVTPLLDRRVTIPPGTRRVYEHVNLLTDSLQRQTGVRVSCCQGVVSGIPWGSTVVAFEAREEPARAVLIRLLRSEPGPGQSDCEAARDHWRWAMRCQPGQAWCAITVHAIPARPG